MIEECDAGLVKIVIPIFIDDAFLGAAGGCGLLLEGGEVDLFSINKITDIDETIIEKLSEEIPVITTQTAETICDFFTKKVNTLVNKYKEP